MQLEAGGINWHYEESGDPNGEPLFLIHGFTGSSRSWDGFVELLAQDFRKIAIELPGHGDTPLPVEKEWSLPRLADSIAEFVRVLEIQNTIVLGYSMGGRIALHLVLMHPPLSRALVLIGASPGITDVQEQQERWERDCALAEKLRERGIEWFSSFWEKQPIFQSQARMSEDKREWLRKQRLANDAENLAYALEQWSSGRQENLYPWLSKIEIPILLLAGERDEKYRAINHEIKRHAVQADTVEITVNAAGHAAHIEQPEATAQFINDFLQRIRNRS
jgi:2-succinyl-6-hydroxy-2,4-cyclohexadiene-1-carboxylate synthase